MSAVHENSSTSNTESVASEKVETSEAAGADERQDSPQTEENDAPWRRSNVRQGQPAMYTALYRLGDSVFWLPDGRRRRQEGPYKVLAVNAGSQGSVYTLEINGRPQSAIPETHLMPTR